MRFLYTKNRGAEVDMACCRATTTGEGRCPSFRQCSRKAVVFEKVKGERKKIGFCKQHSTEAAEKLRAKRKAASDALDARYSQAYRIDNLRRSCFNAFLKMSEIEAIDAGHLSLWQRVQTEGRR